MVAPCEAGAATASGGKGWTVPHLGTCPIHRPSFVQTLTTKWLNPCDRSIYIYIYIIDHIYIYIYIQVKLWDLKLSWKALKEFIDLKGNSPFWIRQNFCNQPFMMVLQSAWGGCWDPPKPSPVCDLFQNMQSWVFCNCLQNTMALRFSGAQILCIGHTTYISIMQSILLIQMGIIMNGGPLLSYPSTLISTWLGGSKQTCLSGSALCIQKHINYQHSMRGFTLPIPTPIPSGRSEMFQQAVWGGFQDSWIRPWVSHHQQPDSSPPPTPLQQILAVSLVSLCLLLNSEAVNRQSLSDSRLILWYGFMTKGLTPKWCQFAGHDAFNLTRSSLGCD